MGFKQKLWCLPKLGKGTLCPNGCTNTWESLCSQDLCTTGTRSTNPRGQNKLCNAEKHLGKLKEEKVWKQKSPVVLLLSPSLLNAHPQQHPQGSGCPQPSHIHQHSDRGNYCHPQINFIILAVHCNLPEEHLEAPVSATTAWNFVRQNPGTSLARGLSPVLCWMCNGSKIIRVQKSKYRDYVTLLQNCATQ